MPRHSARPREEIAGLCFEHLQAVVAQDSQSDERSESIPSSEGQRVLGDQLAAFYEGLGASVERDDFANVIASIPGRGGGAEMAPVALMVHLDTARGTHAVASLTCTEAWSGGPLSYRANPDICVDQATYPAARPFVGQRLIHGPGDAPFGLDDKLGLAHCMTVARLLSEEQVDHPPLIFIARPDEEIGRDAAVEGLAELLQERGVRFGYTVDGIRPFEVNVENFNAAGAWMDFPPAGPSPAQGTLHRLTLRGVNTHGATAKDEGYRSALRFASELQALGVGFVSFASDPERDCDGLAYVRADPAVLGKALVEVVQPHVKRGASWTLEPADAAPTDDANVTQALHVVYALLTSEPGFVVRCEDSEGHQGYSNPYRLLPGPEGLRLDVRVRDFSPSGMEARRAQLDDIAQAAGRALGWGHQYSNMGPRLAEHPELVAFASIAGQDLGPVRQLPIRGGTGVDPFLDRGIPVANLGTGYFAPESEKEFTSLEWMGAHVQWLFRLVQVIALQGAKA